MTIFLHINEWIRLQRSAKPEELTKLSNRKYLDVLTEESQRWLRSWSDTTQGTVLRVTKERNNRQGYKKLTYMNTFAKQDTNDKSAEAVEKARRIIFEDSSYGKQLLSALLESKVVEERDEQVKFKNQIQLRNANIEKHAKFMEVNSDYFKLADKEQTIKLKSKQQAIETARVNQTITRIKNEDNLKLKEEEKQNRMEEVLLLQTLRERDKIDQEKNRELQCKVDKFQEEEHKLISKRRAERDVLDQNIADIWCKYHERIRCKAGKVDKEVQKGKQNTQRNEVNYNLVQNLQDQEKRLYDEFIDKRILQGEKRLIKEEKAENLKKINTLQTRILEAEYNKASAKTRNKKTQDVSSDRQYFLLSRKCKSNEAKNNDEPKSPQFLSRSTKLHEKIIERPSWSGSNAAHAQFARYAAATLAQCKYKNPARKVVEEYRKNNCLDASSLAVENY